MVCKRITAKRKLHFKKLLTVERKLIQEREEEREQKLEAGKNRGHSPGSSQHSLDKHVSFEETQLPAINKGFITHSKYLSASHLLIFTHLITWAVALHFSGVSIDHYTRYIIMWYIPERVLISFSTMAYIYEEIHQNHSTLRNIFNVSMPVGVSIYQFPCLCKVCSNPEVGLWSKWCSYWLQSQNLHQCFH